MLTTTSNSVQALQDCWAPQEARARQLPSSPSRCCCAAHPGLLSLTPHQTAASLQCSHTAPG